MTMTDSPKLEYHESGKPPEEKPPVDSRQVTRMAIVVLGVAVLLSGLVLVLSRSGALERTGSATINGMIVDSAGAPVTDAVVYVEGMTVNAFTDSSGSFSISDAPSGQIILVVGVTPEPPRFYDYSVEAQATTDVGQILITTNE